jgi:hypothetical protein
MDNERVVGRYKNNKVYFDGFLYYIKIDGNIFAVDEGKIELK